MKLTYPAVFTPFSDGSGGYVVEFPDLPGCVTGGSDMEEAIEMAVDAASGWVLNELEEGRPAPEPSAYESFPNKESINMILLDIDAYAKLYGEKSVEKEIPAWMNTYMNNNHINLIQVLQEALFGTKQTA